MAHDGDDRRARLQRFGRVLFALEADFDVGCGDALDRVAEFGGDQLGGIGIDGLVDRRQHAHLHQRLDDVDAAFGHAVGEFLDGDRLGHDDLAHLLRRRLLLLQLVLALLFALPADRRLAANLLVVLLVEDTRDGQLGTAGARLVAPRRRGWTLDAEPWTTRPFFLFFLGLDLTRGREQRDLGGRGLAGTLGDGDARIFLGLGLAARLFVGAALDLAARRNGVAGTGFRGGFRLVGPPLDGAAALFGARGFRRLAILFLGTDGALERASAMGALLGRQALRQHHAAPRRGAAARPDA